MRNSDCNTSKKHRQRSDTLSHVVSALEDEVIPDNDSLDYDENNCPFDIFSSLWKRLDFGVEKIQIKYGQYTNYKSANASSWQ